MASGHAGEAGVRINDWAGAAKAQGEVSRAFASPARSLIQPRYARCPLSQCLAVLSVSSVACVISAVSAAQDVDQLTDQFPHFAVLAVFKASRLGYRQP